MHTIQSLVVDSVEKSYGDRQILRGCSLYVSKDEKVGIVGVNGAGKSTLLRIVSGIEETDAGKIHLSVSVAILDQHPKLQGKTVGEAIKQASKWHEELLQQYHQSMEEEDWDTMSLLQERLDAVGWDLSHNIDSMLQKLQAPAVDRDISVLSGGEIRRVALAKTLLSGAELLILDEPTNHLDAETIEWLESYLVGYRGAVLLVTHDRYLLETVAERIVEVEDGLCVSYEGSYGDYLVASAERHMRLRHAEEKRLKLIAQEAQWAAKSPAARSTKQKARLQRLDELKAQRNMPKDRVLDWNFVTEDKFGSTLLEMDALSLRFGQRLLFERGEFTLSPKQRIGITGKNGTGKSSLLKIITGQLEATTGNIRKQSRLQIGLLDQHRTGLKPDDTVYESVGACDFVEVHGRKVHVTGFLGSFLFDRTMLDQKVSLLSGGERARLLMAKLLLQGCNLLLLDEPTNDLDLLTLRALEEALLDFGGAALIVSHDRAFVDRVCTSILHISDQSLTMYADRHQVRLSEQRKQAEQKQQVLQKSQIEPNKHSNVDKQATKITKKGLSFAQKKELEELPSKIEKEEQDVQRLQEVLADPNTYSDPSIQVADIHKRLLSLEAQIETMYARWSELSDLES